MPGNNMAQPIIIRSNHKVRVHPLPSGRCRLEIDTVVTWETAIQVMKALDYLGDPTSPPQMQNNPT